MKYVHKKILAAVLGLALGSVAGYYFFEDSFKEPAEKSYELVIITSIQGTDVPVGAVLIKNPRPQVDGSLCFYLINFEKNGCLKLNTYRLTEIELE